MVPYTIDAVSAIRYQAANCTPATEIQKILGWDASMLERVCRKHGIDVFVPMPTTVPMLPDVPASVKPLPRPLFSVAPNLAAIIAKLTPRQAEIFRFLRSHAHSGQLWNADHIRHAINAESTTSTRAIGVSTKALGRRLERMGAEYRIERRKGQGGGFRLVYGEIAP